MLETVNRELWILVDGLRFLITYYGLRHHTPRKLPPPVELFFTFVRHFSNQSSRSSSDIRRPNVTRSRHTPAKPCVPLTLHIYSQRASHFFELRFSRHSLSKFILLYSSPHVVLISSQCQGGDVCKTHDTSRNRTGDLEVTT